MLIPSRQNLSVLQNNSDCGAEEALETETPTAPLFDEWDIITTCLERSLSLRPLFYLLIPVIGKAGIYDRGGRIMTVEHIQCITIPKDIHGACAIHEV